MNQLRSKPKRKADGAPSITYIKTKLPVGRMALCAGKWVALCWTQNRQIRPPRVGSTGPWQGLEEPNRSQSPPPPGQLQEKLEMWGYRGPLPYPRLPPDGRWVSCEEVTKGYRDFDSRVVLVVLRGGAGVGRGG